MISKMEKQAEKNMKKGSDCVHVSMDRREDIQWQETTEGGRQKDKARKMRTKSEMTEPKTARRSIDLFHFCSIPPKPNSGRNPAETLWFQMGATEEHCDWLSRLCLVDRRLNPLSCAPAVQGVDLDSAASRSEVMFPV